MAHKGQPWNVSGTDAYTITYPMGQFLNYVLRPIHYLIMLLSYAMCQQRGIIL